MSKNKRIAIVAHFCDYGQENTNNRFNYLAERLAEKGFDVELVTSSFSHRDKCQRNTVDGASNSYKTTLIYEPSYKRNISLKRLFVSHPAMAKNLKRYLETCEKPDLIYCAIPSVNVAEQAARFAKRKKIPFVLDVQDLWPEAYRLILKNDILYRVATSSMKKRVDKVYAAADQIVAVSETYAKRAKTANETSAEPIVVYLGTEAAAFDAAVKETVSPYMKPEDEFWIGYCGTLGHSYDLGTVMDAMKILADRGIQNHRLVVMGSGPLEEKFQAKAADLGIRCTFTGKLPYGQMCAQLKQCDIAVNPIAAGAAQSIINKHGDYALAGMPVVNTQENEEYRSILKEYDCGISCQPGNAEQVADGIYALLNDKELCAKMHDNARKMGVEKFDRAETYDGIVEGIQPLLTV